MIMYALQVDYDDGSAFMAEFFGYSLSGLGAALIGFSSRSGDYFKNKVWSTILIAVGLILMLLWPVALFTITLVLTSIKAHQTFDNFGGYLYAIDFLLVTVVWLILGALTAARLQEAQEQPVI